MTQKKKTQQEAYLSIRHYCAYQERCHKEVKEKLYSWGLLKTEVENIIVQLIEDNFLNEERFAKTFAGGKFRVKKWGRKKILQKLKEKQITDYCIKKAMQEIPEEDYLVTLDSLVEKKHLEITSNTKQIGNEKGKIAQYLYNRGFESELIWGRINTYFSDRIKNK